MFGFALAFGVGEVFQLFSVMDSAMDLDAPFSSDLGVSPRLADRAAPAAFCWAADFAGMGVSFRSEEAVSRPAVPDR